MHIFQIQKLLANFSRVHFERKPYFLRVLHLHFAQKIFSPSVYREAFILHGFLMVTSHSKATRTSATMRRSNAGGIRKQPKKTAQGKKNEEAAVGSNTTASLFGKKAPKRRLVRSNMTKRQSFSVKKRGKYKYDETLKSKSLKAKTTGKSNISPGDVANNNEEEKKKGMKWSAEYFHKMQEFWYENTSIAIELNGYTITYLK